MLSFQSLHGQHSFLVGSPPSPCIMSLTTFTFPRMSLNLTSFSRAQESATAEPKNKNDWKSKAKRSTQLKRWSMARSLRSPRTRNPTIVPQWDENINLSTSMNGNNGRETKDDNSDSDWETLESAGKAIYMVSDGTGWTAEHSVNAALGQFEHCLADRACAVNTHLFSGIDDMDRLMEIIRQAAEEEALVLYTLADRGMAEAAKKGCEMWGVPATDILGPTTEAIAAHLGVAPLGVGRGSPTRISLPLSKHYFKRIEAVEFTIKHDDGALPYNLNEADLVLVGVSRTSKTPLSTYIAQKGYKVANVPLVLGVDPPKQLFEVDADKVFGLVISPAILQTIRAARAHTLGFSFDSNSNYSEMDHIRREVDYANKIFAQNRRWPVIEVTGKAIEETAAVVLRIYHEKKQK